MRVAKKAAERQTEILDAAEQLFQQKGFNGTSTNDILKKVGIARGTLYYHFKSKEMIMDSLIERYTIELLTTARKIAKDKTIPIADRIIGVIMALNLKKENTEEIIEHIHKPENVLMHYKIKKIIINNIPPILTNIIKEGIEQNLFDTPIPYECMEMVTAYTNTVFDNAMIQMTPPQQVARIEAFIYNTERLLGTKHGSLAYLMQAFENKNGGIL